MPLGLRFPRIPFISSKSPAVTTTSTVNVPPPVWRHFSRVFFTALFYFGFIPLYITRNHYSAYTADGPSMSPLLSPPHSPSADVFIIRKNIRLSTDPVSEGGDGRRSELERGMVVTFWNPMSREPRLCVKRVVALEGDVVKVLKRRRLYDRAGRATDVDVYAEGRGDEVKVPFGHVWVEGVNEDASIDSTEFGPISKSLITGIATKIFWPKVRRGEIRWEEDWKRSCRKRVKIAREDGMVPEEWTM